MTASGGQAGLAGLVEAVPRTGEEPMTPAELRMVREWLGLTHDQLAGLLGVQARTVRRWEAGTHLVPDGAREDIETLELATAEAVGQLVELLGDLPDHPTLRIPRTGPGPVWAGRTWPTGWWRMIAMRVAQEVPGLTVDYQGHRTTGVGRA